MEFQFEQYWKEYGENELSHSETHYLLTIYSLLQKNCELRASTIAKELGISRNAVHLQLKKLSEKKRLALFPEIQQKALAWSVGHCSPAEIDELNILQATMVAMQRAIAGLAIQPDLVLIDGNRVPQLPMHSIAVVKGDMRVAQISAASIIAKVVRDKEMEALDKLYPQFGFAQHKGYPTKAHFAAIEQHGVIAEHRKSFKPVKRVLGID